MLLVLNILGYRVVKVAGDTSNFVCILQVGYFPFSYVTEEE